ncbi:DNA polymerase III subunit alpha [Candidatus Riesia sp. GBBU]|nr:DNA polymerase III subunit alpha [Candidatus Riesia sp. GBBU]
MKDPNFIHLNVHSDYSIKDGIIKIYDLIKRCIDLKIPSIAITDFTNLYGVIKFYQLAHKSGIKPIIGADFYIESEYLKEKKNLITILSKNKFGYQNLILLISEAYKKGYDESGPTITKDLLFSHKEGLLLILGGIHGEIGKLFLKDDVESAKNCIKFYQKNFYENYYLEISRINKFQEKKYIFSLIDFSFETNTPIVAVNNVRFMYKKDFLAHEIRVAIHKGITLNEQKKYQEYTVNQYLKTESEMIKLFSDLPEALKNSVEISKRCNVILEFKKYFLPKFPTKEVSESYVLEKMSKAGLEKRLKLVLINTNEIEKKRLEYFHRLNYELNVIDKMGFSGYFLIVMEFIQWAKNNNIPVGPGRGSGAGSLVLYSLEITDIDPIKFNLLFERFLNPERISMPDIDIDFCMEKRDKVIEHVSNVYGRDSVSQIIAFGRMTARAVIRDVGRALNHPYSLVDKVAKLIPNVIGMTIDKAIQTKKKLKKMFNEDEEIQDLLNISKNIEGIIKNEVKHAGGVVISPTKITDYSPIYCDENGDNILTQFDKDDIEKIGLVKFDFLGLRTLTVIQNSLNMINRERNKNRLNNIDLSLISLSDKRCFRSLQLSNTTALFQLESYGVKDLIKKLHPDCFEDIVALIALFRPGPLQSGMVENFINRKHGREKIYYPDSKWQHILLKPILKETYGIILYQEQVMKIAQIFSGYTLGEADLLRRAIGKKNKTEMKKQRSTFKSGAISNGICESLSMKIFDLVEKFSNYGFNKSHSVAYAFISYQTLWLKTYYTEEFMASVMSLDMDNTKKIVHLINECRSINLTILPPDINKSSYYFHVDEKRKIRYGMGAIKGVGKNTIDSITDNRKYHGEYKNILDFYMRIDHKKLNKRVTEKLIFSGIFDSLYNNRKRLILNLEKLLKISQEYSHERISGQTNIFWRNKNFYDLEKIFFEDYYEFFPIPILEKEKETLGIYLTNHPTRIYENEVKNCIDINNIKFIHTSYRKKFCTFFGVIIKKKLFETNKMEKTAIFTIEDYSDSIEIILRNKELKKYKNLLKENNILIVYGEIVNYDFQKRKKIIAKYIKDLDEFRKKSIKSIFIIMDFQKINEKIINKIYSVLSFFQEKIVPVYFYYNKKNNIYSLSLSDKWFVNPTNTFIKEINDLSNTEQIKVKFNYNRNIDEYKLSGF